MTTALNVTEEELSKQLGDYWSSAATATASNIQLTDLALQDKSSDWLTDGASLQMLTLNAAVDTSERTLNAINVSTGFVTWNRVLTGNTTNADTYRIHRLFTASEKKRALINACKMSFPFIHERIRDENKTTGDWLKDGGLEVWASSVLNYWTVNAVTVAQTTTNDYVKRGLSSAKLSTAIGDIYQDTTLNPDLKELVDTNVTFKGKIWCDTANCAMLQIYDGATTTNSPYHPGTSAFSDEGGGDDFIEVSASIAANATDVIFKVIQAAVANTYVDDLRVTGPRRDKIYIGDLGLAQNEPHMVSFSSDGNIFREPWNILHSYSVDSENGWLFIKDMPNNYRLRIEGIGYLDFKVSGVVNTTWTAVVNINSPQTEILAAQAALYLCNQKSLPTQESGVSDDWMKARENWRKELIDRKMRFGMSAPPATTHWGI